MRRLWMRLAVWAAAACAAWAAEVSGVVVADDGMPFLGPVEVRIACAGEQAAAPVADSADGAGRFRFRFPSAPEEDGCELTAAAAGYIAARTPLGSLPAAAGIPALALRRAGKYQGETLSVSHLAAPPEARAAFEAAARRLFAGAIDEAAAALRKAVESDPQYAAAWFELGRLLLARNDAAGARRAFARAVAADPWFVAPYEPLLLLERAAGREETVAALCAKLRRINPYRRDGCAEVE